MSLPLTNISMTRLTGFFYCFLAPMAAVQTEDIRASFLFVGDLNGQHQEWLGSTTRTVMELQLLTLQLSPVAISWLSAQPMHVVGPMTDVPEVVWVAVVAPIGNSDHSSLSAVISMAQAVPNLCGSRKVFLKHQVNWNTVCGEIQDLPRRNIWHADNLIEVLNEHLSLLVGRYAPTKVSVCVTRISLGLMINSGMRLALSRRLIFSESVIALGLTGKSLFPKGTQSSV